MGDADVVWLIDLDKITRTIKIIHKRKVDSLPLYRRELYKVVWLVMGQIYEPQDEILGELLSKY